jgi:hypothetical protein
MFDLSNKDNIKLIGFEPKNDDSRSVAEQVILYMAGVRPPTYWAETDRIHHFSGSIRSINDTFAVAKYIVPTLTEEEFNKTLAKLCGEKLINIQFCFEINRFTIWYAHGENKESCFYGYQMINNVVNLRSRIYTNKGSCSPKEEYTIQADNFRNKYF